MDKLFNSLSSLITVESEWNLPSAFALFFSQFVISLRLKKIQLLLSRVNGIHQVTLPQFFIQFMNFLLFKSYSLLAFKRRQNSLIPSFPYYHRERMKFTEWFCPLCFLVICNVFFDTSLVSEVYVMNIQPIVKFYTLSVHGHQDTTYFVLILLNLMNSIYTNTYKHTRLWLYPEDYEPNIPKHTHAYAHSQTH